MRYVLALVLLLLTRSVNAASLPGDELRTALLSMQERSTIARNALAASPESKLLAATVAAIDDSNRAHVEAIITKYGWPTRALVGDDALRAAWEILERGGVATRYTALAERGQR